MKKGTSSPALMPAMLTDFKSSWEERGKDSRSDFEFARLPFHFQAFARPSVFLRLPLCVPSCRPVAHCYGFYH